VVHLLESNAWSLVKWKGSVPKKGDPYYAEPSVFSARRLSLSVRVSFSSKRRTGTSWKRDRGGGAKLSSFTHDPCSVKSDLRKSPIPALTVWKYTDGKIIWIIFLKLDYNIFLPLRLFWDFIKLLLLPCFVWVTVVVPNLFLDNFVVVLKG